EAILQSLDGVIGPAQLDQGRPQQLVNLGKLRAQLKRPPEGADGVLILARLQVQLAEAKVPEFVIGIVIGHLLELGNTFLQLTHATDSCSFGELSSLEGPAACWAMCNPVRQAVGPRNLTSSFQLPAGAEASTTRSGKRSCFFCLAALSSASMTM